MSERSIASFGIPAARSYLWVARISAEKYLNTIQEDETDRYNMMLYYGSFFMFARASLEALSKSDSRENSILNEVQNAYFRQNIKDHPLYELVKNERDRVCHGDDSWAAHPFKTMSMLKRFDDAGGDLYSALFQQTWPDGDLQGESLNSVMNAVWKQISAWLDAIHALENRANKGKA